MNRYSSRKFILAVGVLLISAYLVYGKHISGGTYSAVVIAGIGAYIAGNVAQKKIEVKE